MDAAAGGSTAAKRAVTVLLAVVAGWLVSPGLGTATTLTDDPAVVTESFETGPGLPAGWRFVEFTEGNSTATIASGAGADGTHFLRIVSGQLNHARVVVPVTVTPNTSYRFQVMVKASGANANMAAVLGIDGRYTVTESVNTDTQWRPLNLYLKVGPQTTVDLTMGLGHFGQLNIGTADFDAVTFAQVSEVPSDAAVADLAAAAAAPAAPATPDDSSPAEGPSAVVWVFVVILVLVGTGAAVFFMLRADKKSTTEAGTVDRAD